VLAPAVSQVLAPRGLSQLGTYETLTQMQRMGVKSSKMHDYGQLTYVNPYKLFTNLPLSFLIF
jgi:hypothetical protein